MMREFHNKNAVISSVRSGINVFSRTSEASASKVLENIEDKVPETCTMILLAHSNILLSVLLFYRSY